MMARGERKDESVRESHLMLHLSCSNARTLTYYKVLITDFSIWEYACSFRAHENK
jgi:hypothetical protein